MRSISDNVFCGYANRQISKGQSILDEEEWHVS